MTWPRRLFIDIVAGVSFAIAVTAWGPTAFLALLIFVAAGVVIGLDILGVGWSDLAAPEPDDHRRPDR